MTNGEKIKEIFPDINIYEHGSTYSINNEYNFNASWWNAEYQEPCEDWRDVPSDEMTLEQARQAVKDLRKMFLDNWMQEPITKNDLGVDCISRQAVIDNLYDWSNHSMTDAETWHLRQVIGDIKSMPSVTPQEPKRGHWIFTKTIFDKHGCTVECSSCHKKWKTYDEIRWKKEINFCPKCGSKMESEVQVADSN